MGERKFDVAYAARELNGVGLDPEEVMISWAAGAVTQQATLERNLQTIRELQAAEKGMPRVLNSEFGIRNFGRYPVEVLLDQFKERDNAQDDSVLWVTAEFDPYAEFYKFTSRVGRFHASLDKGVNLRVVECESVSRTSGRLSEYRDRYAPIEKSVWVAHGYEAGMVVAEGEEINRTSLSESVGQTIKSAFAPNPLFILISCKTGAEGGFAQDLSALVGGRVEAPKFKTSLEIIKAVDRDINVTFVTDLSMRHREYPLRGDKAVYERGYLLAA